ncbi:MAG: hypothetical protein IKP91_11725 [Bacteroidaceae bacterium]|nr:hypothetical protein [Bacteroidaceae bacterium]
MKRTVILLIVSLCFMTIASAQEVRGPRFMKPEEYKAKQQEFITQRAGLTETEAKAFFPIYFELQTEKFKLNGQLRRKTRELMADGLTEDEASELLDETAEMKMKCDKLEKDYLPKFKAILPASKLLRIQMAEEAFRRELLNNMQRGRMPFGNEGQKRQ